MAWHTGTNPVVILNKAQKRLATCQKNVDISILDEPDSGLDIDAVQSVAKAISFTARPDATIIVITHYARILKFLSKLDYVHVLADGKMIKEGPKELADELEQKGYGWLGIQEAVQS